MISRIDPERELYEARLQERRDQAARRQAALEAEQAAHANELAKGRAEMLRTAIPALQNSLGQTVMTADELQALSGEELESIWSGLLKHRK